MAKITVTAGTVTADLTAADVSGHGWLSEIFNARPYGDYPRLILDLMQVPYPVESAFVGCIAACWRRAVREKGWRLEIRAHKEIAEQLRSLGLSQLPNSEITVPVIPLSASA